MRPALRRLLAALPALVGLALFAVVAAGFAHGVRVPKFSKLAGTEESPETDDWCKERGLPESACPHCHPELAIPADAAVCGPHGLAGCVLCRPELSQREGGGAVPAEVLANAAEAVRLGKPPPLAAEGEETLPTTVTLASADTLTALGIGSAPAVQVPVTEAVAAVGETAIDPRGVIRVTPRAAGTLGPVFRELHDYVKAGEVLALLDIAEVGQAKAEFQQALLGEAARTQALATLKDAPAGVVAPRLVAEALLAVADAEVRLLAAEQALRNWGLAVSIADYRPLTPTQVADRLRRLGVPDKIETPSASSNWLALVSPIAGQIVETGATRGEAVGPGRSLFVVADVGRAKVTLAVGLEAAGRVRVGQAATFKLAGGPPHAGTVAWISPEIDPKSRTVQVLLDWPGAAVARPPAHATVTATINIRTDPGAVAVPRDAVYTVGAGHVVFVRDRADRPAVTFHVRQVVAGGDAPGGLRQVVGVLPGESVATVNSGMLRSELLKALLGAD